MITRLPLQMKGTYTFQNIHPGIKDRKSIDLFFTATVQATGSSRLKQGQKLRQVLKLLLSVMQVNKNKAETVG